jgi:hypothetical protein
MRIHNVTFPIFITQTYIDQGNSGAAERPNNSSVELKNFTFANITGDINSDNPGDGSCRTNVSRIHRPTLPTGKKHLADNISISPAGTTKVSTPRKPKASSSSATPTPLVPASRRTTSTSTLRSRRHLLSFVSTLRQS